MNLLTKRGALAALAAGLLLAFVTPSISHAATASTTERVSLRAGTSTSTALLTQIPKGTSLNVVCQAKGQAINGTYSSDWWAKTTYGGKTGYVSRAYVRVPAGQNVPTCTDTAPKPDGNHPGVGQPISRDLVIARAMDWVNRGVPYSMSKFAPDRNGRLYRTDCSGMVSMALHLPESASTVTLPKYLSKITKSSLRKGDVIGNLGPGTGGANGHVVIFDGWANSAQTQFYSIEENGRLGAVRRTVTWGSSFWNKQAWRYNKITG